MSTKTNNVNDQRKSASDTNLADNSMPDAMEGGVKLKMPVGLLGHVTRAQATLETLRKSGGVEGVVREAFQKYESELLRLKKACEGVTPVGDVQRAAKEAWIERNIVNKEKYLLAMKSVFEPETPRLQVNDESLEKDSMKSAVSGSTGRSVASSARREAVAKIKALELEVEHRRRQRQLEEEERLLRLRREDEELQLRLQQARLMEEALESDHGSQRAESIRGPVEDGGVREAAFLPPVGTWIPTPPPHRPPTWRPPRPMPATFDPAEGLLQQVLLPQSKLPVFKGDHLEFMWFMRAFEMRVEGVTLDPARRLHLLLQHLEGDAKTLVMGCQLADDPGEGYARAKAKLMEKYGNKVRQALAFKAKLLAWPPLKKDSIADLDKFSTQLQLCSDVKLAGGLAELDAAGTLVQLMHKLPQKLQETWQMRAYKIETHQDREATFTDFSRFVGDLAAARTHPVYGSRADSKTEQLGNPPTGRKVKTLATKAADNEQIEELGSVSSSQEVTCSTMTKGVDAFKAPCLFCEGNHAGEKCRTALQMPLKEKRRKLEGLCFACLQEGHLARQCPKRAVCSKCNGPHPTVLHFERLNKPDAKGKGELEGEKAGKSHNSSSGQSTATSCATVDSTRVAVAVLPVKVWCAGSTPKVVKAILDPGSTATFLTERLANDMGLKTEASSLQLTTMTSKQEEMATQVVAGVKVAGLDHAEVLTLPPMYTVGDMPYHSKDIAQQEDVEAWTHLYDVPFDWVDAEVELLIGMNAPEALRPRRVVSGEDNEPYAVQTALGWCFNGPLRSLRTQEKRQATANLMRTEELKTWLERLHASDFSGAHDFDSKGPSQEDEQWMRMVTASATRAEGDEAHYQIALPFRDERPPLMDNREQAMRRLLSLKRRLLGNDQFRHDYIAFMEDMQQKGYVEEVTVAEKDENKPHGPVSSQRPVSYVTHHGVYHPRKPTKIRVVFDCSSKCNGVSINDCLIPGPDLTSSLLGVLLRFRQEKVAFTADIEAMFYQVFVPRSDRDALRYLWWPGGEVGKTPSTYRMKVHLFGAASSPSCANFALRKAADDALAAGDIEEDVCQSMKKNFYVDDCLKSVPTEDEAIRVSKGLVTACKMGGFRLTKFVATSSKVLQAMPSQEWAKGLQRVDLREDKNDPLGSLQERALGVSWNVSEDSFNVLAMAHGPNTNQTQEGVVTKRSMLSTLSAVYDPLGMVAPVIIVARIMFRNLTRDAALGWDDSLDERHGSQQRWTEWVYDLPRLNEVSIDRCFRPPSEDEDAVWQLHVFCDASEDAYAAVAYLRQWRCESNQAHVAFVMGKARVTPPKVVTIPRLELTAAKLATEVASTIQRELEYSVERRVFWTDSQTVLKYLGNKVRRFHTFVANRVNSILAASDQHEWRHVPTQCNPADEGSRGVQAGALSRSMWLSGPEFLRQEEEKWPVLRQPGAVDENDVEVRVLATQEVKPPPCFVENLSKRYSTMSQLRTAVRVWMKFVSYVGGRSDRTHLTRVEELKEAETAIVRGLQRQQWPNEVKCLSKGKELLRSSPLHRLSPMMAQGGVIVMDSRARSLLPIIPGRSNVARLMVLEAHVAQAHFGRQATASHVLNKWWIVGLNKLAREVIKGCEICQRKNAKPTAPKMAALPRYRTCNESGWAFETTGIDYFGPFLIKRARSTVKMWGVIFTCSTTRAVHLEAAEDLSSSAFLNALRRFVARRGHVKRIVSDNGTNFVGAETMMTQELKKELAQQRAHESKTTIIRWLEKREIDWIFNPPSASHHGGFWERLIRSVRQALFVLMPEQRPFTYDGMATVLCEVESVLNNRPLTVVSEDPNDYEALTPNHLLLGREGPTAPPGDFRRTAIPLKRQWRRVQHVASAFWRRWINDYKNLLHQRSKWHQDGGRMMERGDVVLLVDPIKPREYWQLGRITHLHRGKNDKVRVVTVKTAKGVLTRPVSKLCLLEAASTANKADQDPVNECGD